jgi:hypothetical protein
MHRGIDPIAASGLPIRDTADCQSALPWARQSTRSETTRAAVVRGPCHFQIIPERSGSGFRMEQDEIVAAVF